MGTFTVRGSTTLQILALGCAAAACAAPATPEPGSAEEPEERQAQRETLKPSIRGVGISSGAEGGEAERRLTRAADGAPAQNMLQRGATTTDAKGQVWRYLGKANFAKTAKSPTQDGTATPATDLDYTQLSDEALAEQIQPVKLVGDDVYKMASPPIDFVRAVRAAAKHGKAVSAPGLPTAAPPAPIPSDSSAPPAPISSFSFDQGITDSDDRIPVTQYSSVYYPYSTLVSFGENLFPGTDSTYLSCTGAMIGPRTVVTAAHCFWSIFNSWYPTHQWAAGQSTFYSNGNLITNVASGIFTGCYSVSIPSAFITSRTDVNDYAVVEMHPACDLTPYTGWLGFYAPSIADYANAAVVQLDGYPGGAPSVFYPFPSLYTHIGSGSNLQPWSPPIGQLVYHNLDATFGNSGGPIRIPYPGQTNPLYVGAVHRGFKETNNVARAMDSTLISFIYAASSSM